MVSRTSFSFAFGLRCAKRAKTRCDGHVARGRGDTIVATPGDVPEGDDGRWLSQAATRRSGSSWSIVELVDRPFARAGGVAREDFADDASRMLLASFASSVVAASQV
jgi:hypothetical protein